MKYKTSELEGYLLDAAAAKALGLRYVLARTLPDTPGPYRCTLLDTCERFEPSTLWADGGPIIERENIVTALLLIEDDNFMNRAAWCSWVLGLEGHYAIDTSGGTPDATGDSCLMAAMRAFVFSRHGDTVDL